MDSFKKLMLITIFLAMAAPAGAGAMDLRGHSKTVLYTPAGWDWNAWFGKKAQPQNEPKKPALPLATSRSDANTIDLAGRTVTAEILMQNLAKSNAANDAAFAAMLGANRARQEQLQIDLARYEQTRDWSQQAEEQRIREQQANQRNSSPGNETSNTPAQKQRIFLKPKDTQKPSGVFLNYGGAR